jgi:hypothetical protein
LSEGGPPGDFDGDFDVDGVDLGMWKTAYGPNGGGDADNDGDSDGADFLIWQQNITGAPGVAAIPEPAALTSGLLALAGLFARIRQRA